MIHLFGNIYHSLMITLTMIYKTRIVHNDSLAQSSTSFSRRVFDAHTYRITKSRISSCNMHDLVEDLYLMNESRERCDKIVSDSSSVRSVRNVSREASNL